jgi:DMSO/TMAO reductase YedYZ molybdopterin-dependent catalytic subunit
MADEPKFLTRAQAFRDVSRGNPVPHTLKGDALVKARLTPETWRLEIVADKDASIAKSLRIEDNTALDFDALLALGKSRGVRFLKAMQCNNIPLPLGQGLWEGVPLRELLRLTGRFRNVRRVYYWGFHNDDDKQMFRSSVALSQALDSAPGELPAFVAYRLNGEPIPLVRGGPVRMVVPWAHGFKSVKWLQRIVLTNDYHTNDTYALANNDPESYLKTAAYHDDLGSATFAVGKPATLRGTCMVGWPGLKRVEYWLRPDAGTHGKIDDDDPAWEKATWQPCTIEPPPEDWGSALPDGVLPRDVWGFDGRGKPKEWPLRYSIARWSATLRDLKAGGYEFRVRTVDRNDFAQPEPRPSQQSGKNAIACKQFMVT